jgi:hypothetical protein
MRARKNTDAELKMLSLKIRKDVWFAWKVRALMEETTMSELCERLVMDYLAKEPGVESVASYQKGSRGVAKAQRKVAGKPKRNTVHPHRPRTRKDFLPDR